jgi:tetratricopeptide (TPR) repeat protein
MSRNKQTQTKTSPYQKIALILFGVFLTVVILEIGLRLGGFVLLSIKEHRNRISISKKGSYRIMCLGESTTAGQYPLFLEEILNQRNIGIKFSVIDKGIIGTSTAAILSMLESDLDTYHPDMVITMMGINDMGPHLPYEAVSDSKFINLLRSFRTYKLSRLLWLHIVTKLKDPKQPKPLLQRVELQQVYAEDKDASSSEALLKFSKAIEVNPKNERAYIELGMFYQNKSRFSEAEELFKKAIELDPRNDYAYFGLGDSYQNMGRLFEAEELFRKAIELKPKNDWAYLGLGKLYKSKGRFSEAEELFKRAIELNPNNEWAYIGLGISYQRKGRFSEAEVLFKKAIKLNPKDDWAYYEQGKFYLSWGRFLEVEESFKKAIELNPKNEWAYFGLGKFYQNKSRFSEAEESFKKAIELDPKDDRVYGALEVLFKEMDNLGLAREYGKKAKELRSSYYYSITTDNYNKLKAILGKRGIAYVCVQYPMRNLEPLKKIFQGNAEGIIFVDNELLFKNVLKKTSYQEYFCDNFGGDFGHCTEKGNRLLAESIANTILKEVFNK